MSFFKSKNNVFLSFCIFYSININIISAQEIWTKSDKTNLYEAFLSDVAKFKSLTVEQKESLALCSMQELTIKYTKQEYQNKIDIEIKRINSSMIDLCAKNNGINLDVSKDSPVVQSVDSSKSDVNDWTKEDKLMLVKQSLKSLEDSKFSDIDKETIALCFVEQTCSNLSKSDYQNMISLELDRYTKTINDKCITKNKLSIVEPQKEVKESTLFNKSFLLGVWNTDSGFKISFNEDGTFIKSFKTDFWIANRITKIENSQVTGDWFLDEAGNLTLNELWTELDYKLFKTISLSYKATGVYSLVSNSEDFYKIRFSNGSYCCTENGGEPLQIIQANRIK